MNNDIISRAELEKELLKEYSQALSNQQKHPEEPGYGWKIEELDKVLKIAREIPKIPDERIVVPPEGAKPAGGEKKGVNETDERMEKETEGNRHPADENKKQEDAGVQGVRK